MKERWQPELTLSVIALAISLAAFALSYRQSHQSAVTGIMPVLALVYGEDGRLPLKRLDRGADSA